MALSRRQQLNVIIDQFPKIPQIESKHVGLDCYIPHFGWCAPAGHLAPIFLSRLLVGFFFFCIEYTGFASYFPPVHPAEKSFLCRPIFFLRVTVLLAISSACVPVGHTSPKRSGQKELNPSSSFVSN